MNIPRFFALSFALLLGISLYGPAFAHDAFSGKTEANLDENGKLMLKVDLASVTVEGFVGHISDRDNQVSARNLHNIHDALSDRAKSFYRLSLGGQTLVADKIEIEIVDAEDAVLFRLYYPGPVEGKVGFLNEFILDTNPEYKSTLTVKNAHDVQLGLHIHTMEERYSEVEMSSSLRKPNMENVFGRFLQLGIHHIVVGFDHLLFLAGLLLVCRTWRSALGVVTVFTLAHSLTLSIAALDLIRIPSVWVESAIALSILYVGIENLWTGHQPRFRWLLTGGFGLIHGLGFASVLRDIGLGGDGAPLLLPLLSFNLGVELGQLALTLVFLPLIWWLRKAQYFEKYGVPALSIFIIALGGVG